MASRAGLIEQYVARFRGTMVIDMKKEYDFSKGERGKFFQKDVEFNLPIYLEDEVFTYIEGIAEKRKTDISSIVNQLLRSDIHLIESAK